MATQQQLKNKAAKRLGILATGQTLTGLQDSQLQAAYNALYEKLLKKGFAVWAKAGDIPDAYLTAVAATLAFSMADDVGVADSRYMRLQNADGQAWVDLRELSSVPYVSTTSVTDY